MNRETQSIASTSRLGRKVNRFRGRSLKLAALGLASSGSADYASAAVIYEPTLNKSPDDAFSIDGSFQGTVSINTADLGADLFLKPHSAMQTVSTLEFYVTASGGTMSVDYLTLMNYGETVDGSLVFLADQAHMSQGGTVNPYWSPGTTGYAGFTFNDGSGGPPLYGWLEIEFDASGTDFTVLSFAYDDSGLALNAGWLTNPEPNTALLLGMGLVGFAVISRKRRRARLSAS